MADSRNWKPKYDGDYLEQQVGELRSLFREEFGRNKELYDERDYDRFMDPDDNYNARRWITVHGDAVKAFEMVKDTMRWRRELNVNDFSYEDFPREFYQLGCVFEYGHDKKGRHALYIRIGIFKPERAIKELNKHFFLFMLDQCDKRAKSNEVLLIYDFNDVGWSNVSMMMTEFMLSLRDRFPQESPQTLLLGRSWIAKTILKTVISLSPANYAASIKLVSTDDELLQYINKKQWPPFLVGAPGTKRYYSVPLKAKPVHEYEQFSESFADKIKKHVDSVTHPGDYELVETLSELR